MIKYILFIIASCFTFCSIAQNVGIGTTTPEAKLDVIGTLKVTDGTEGANKILTSNAAGMATWAAAPLPACFLFSTGTSISANSYLGSGSNSSSFIRNTIVAPYNCELTSITLSGRGISSTMTATVYKSNGNVSPSIPVNTGLATSVGLGQQFSTGTGSVFVNRGDLISILISAAAVDGATVTVTYK